MPQHEDWKGKRYICLLRQSDDQDGPTSVAAQLRFLRKECDEDGMVYVDHIALEGMTGVLPAKREDIDQLKHRKLEKDDFDTVAVQVLDRFTRSGADHGIWFEYELLRIGVTVRFVGEDLPEGPFRTSIKAMKLDAARQTSYSTSQRATQGQSFAIEQGRMKTTGQTPFGCWRMYYSSDGKRSHIIRSRSDGIQERLHPDTHEVIATYGTTKIPGAKKQKSYGRYRKQRSEVALLMPGDEDQVRIVRIIFYLWFRRGWRGKRIASILNDHQEASPAGKQWSQRQVESIVENEAYTGRTINSETIRGVFHARKKDSGFVPLDRDPVEIATRKTMPVRYQPMEERDIQDQPDMADFLPPDIKQMAMAYHEQLWEKHTNPRPRSPKKNKHPNSDYLLSNLLEAKQDGEKLVGVLCGRVGHKTRYYRHKRGRRGYRKGSTFNRMFPAEKLEEALIAFVSTVLGDLPDLRKRLTEMVEQQRKALPHDGQSVEAAIRERDEIRDRIQIIIRTFSARMLADAEPELQRLGARREELDRMIEAARGHDDREAEPVEAVVERVIDRIKHLAEDLPSLPKPAVREIIRHLFPKVVGDMETRDVTVTVSLPSWATEPKGGDFVPMCLRRSRQSSASSKTHQDGSGLLLVEGLCEYVATKWNSCYRCRRRAA